ncbi:MAG TPA: di-heme oxidoredictase family protein [Steroidobacter sp.]
MKLKALACTSLACGCAFANVMAAPPISQQQRFQHSGKLSSESTSQAAPASPSEAPTGFDNLTNGFTPQGPAFDTLTSDNVQLGRSFNDDRFFFEEIERIADGLGPTFNGRSCGECHENVVTGGASQIAEHRTGRMSGQVFFESLGGSLIQSRGTHPEVIEHVAYEDDVSTFRISTNTLGAGFVESIANETLLAIRDAQPAEIRGTAVMVPVLEADSAARIGRFGWKSQHASLESFSADAYLNEMGITSPLFPEENTANGRDVGGSTEYDPVADPEDDGRDLVAFADFMRATKAPPRGEITEEVRAGEKLFSQAGCDACHVTSITTGPPGMNINGGKFKIPAALGNKVIHPYSDFLLHDIGSGDGIPVLPTPEYVNTRTQIRTAPLWGLRTRNRLMHDGLSFTVQEAIARHEGQAAATRQRFEALSASEQRLLITFLESL